MLPLPEASTPGWATCYRALALTAATVAAMASESSATSADADLMHAAISQDLCNNPGCFLAESWKQRKHVCNNGRCRVALAAASNPK